jgi:UDP-glucose 4-epimerase
VARHIFTQYRVFYEGDIADRNLIRKIVAEHPDIERTIHMAARVVVPESVAFPYEYYRDNVAKSLELFDELVRLQKAACCVFLISFGIRARERL